jgi:exopolyphosphatase/pppGpp-phosphohydrolase
MHWKLKSVEEYLRKTLAYIPRGLANFTDHGIDHSKRILTLIDEVLPQLQKPAALNIQEEFLLRATAWTHDIGCIVAREGHAKRSAEILQKHCRDFGGIGEYVAYLAPLSKAHSDDGEPINRLYAIPDGPMPLEDVMVRLRYIAAIFRLLDACDVSFQRGPNLVMKILKDEMTSKDIRYWKAHAAILAIRIDPVAGRIILTVEDRRNAGIVLKDIKRNIQQVMPVLRENGWKDLKVESINIVKDPLDRIH